MRFYNKGVGKKPRIILFEDIIMNDFIKDVLTGLVFFIGLMGYISGEFIISSALFATAAIASNVNVTRKQTADKKLSCE